MSNLIDKAKILEAIQKYIDACKTPLGNAAPYQLTALAARIADVGEFDAEPTGSEWDGICLYPDGCSKRKGTCQLSEPCQKWARPIITHDGSPEAKAFVNEVIDAVQAAHEKAADAPATALLRFRLRRSKMGYG